MFRNLSLFRFSRSTAETLALLDDALGEHRLRPCGTLELSTTGFIPPLGEGEHAPLARSLGDYTAFSVGTEARLLPASVVNAALKEKVREIAEKEARKVGGRERRRLKEDVMADLLPRAFVRGSRLDGYIDKSSGWVVLDTASRKAAESALTQLRQALGSFPAVPLAPEEGPRVLLTDWLANGHLPDGLAIGDECELRDPTRAGGECWKGRGADLDAEDVKEHLRSGKQVYQLGLVFDERISFVLGEDLVIRKLKFLDVVAESLNESFANPEEEADAVFALLTAEVSRLLAGVASWFGVPRPEAE